MVPNIFLGHGLVKYVKNQTRIRRLKNLRNPRGRLSIYSRVGRFCRVGGICPTKYRNMSYNRKVRNMSYRFSEVGICPTLIPEYVLQIL